MDDSVLDTSVLPTEAEALDLEIEELHAQVRRLKRHLSHHTTNIISSPFSTALQSRLQTTPDDGNPLLQTSATQSVHNTTTLYRTCASITTFRVQDPDPAAVDNGRVLGIRIESFSSSSGRYQRPYYVFLNKPYAKLGKEGREILRVHRHTLPPAINITELARRYLPVPKGSGDILKIGKQDPGAFVRALRREVAGYGNRLAVIKSTRKRLGLDEKKGKSKGIGITDVSAVDAEASQVSVQWKDGSVGRVVIDGRGEIEKVVIVGEDGRDRIFERRLLGDGRIEGLVDRLMNK